ncbi:unnamed protein product [Leptidea sinapis]|uniref:Tetraspanin n=2 Tax=Leptidea sinapis TaxID=189913 RepID=A0A5E4QGZ3_9NEOP|nr:unnamed protein product [Leptidea sinapis]
MTPTNLYILNAIAKGTKIEHKAIMVCCPLWLCIMWIIVINIVGVVLCLRLIMENQDATSLLLTDSLRKYRQNPKYKHFIDNLQWSLGCCGVHSYKDWFTQEWHDHYRDYEWEPIFKTRDVELKSGTMEVDSVPFSCCKSGSCVSSYLTELGTNSINTTGCSTTLYNILLLSANAHLVVFVITILLEIVILRFIILNSASSKRRSTSKKLINHIMAVNTNFDASSNSFQYNPDSDYEVGE